MKKLQKTSRKELFGPRTALGGGALIILALFVTAQARAAPVATAVKSKAARAPVTALDPVALRPSWIPTRDAARPAARLAPTVERSTGVFRTPAAVSLVQVPVRPQPRSPWLPPEWR